MSKFRIINNESLQELETCMDNYFDSVVTDPPYGLGKEPNASDMLSAWIEHGYLEVKGKGFMGSQWDSFVPQPKLWKEIYRVLKPGGHVIAFFGTRTYDWGVMAVRLAGFEVRDMMTWNYGQGFPKSLNIEKSIRSQKGSDEQANFWSGWGTALKPAIEPILLARKPLEDGLTIAQNVMKWGTGALNIEGCRIDLNGDYKSKANGRPSQTGLDDNYDSDKTNQPDDKGRFPANFILDEEASKQLDEQSGVLKSGAMKKAYQYTNTGYSLGKPTGSTKQIHEADEGYASRFFYCAKATRGERNKGLEDVRFEKVTGHNMMDTCSVCGGRIMQNPDRPSACKCENPVRIPNTVKGNFHPTVKPVKLMRYLVKLVTPAGGIVLDPFNGSGTTGIGCILEDLNYVGIDSEKDYCDISIARIKAWKSEKESNKNKS